MWWLCTLCWLCKWKEKTEHVFAKNPNQILYIINPINCNIERCFFSLIYNDMPHLILKLFTFVHSASLCHCESGPPSDSSILLWAVFTSDLPQEDSCFRIKSRQVFQMLMSNLTYLLLFLFTLFHKDNVGEKKERVCTQLGTCYLAWK